MISTEKLTFLVSAYVGLMGLALMLVTLVRESAKPDYSFEHAWKREDIDAMYQGQSTVAFAPIKKSAPRARFVGGR